MNKYCIVLLVGLVVSFRLFAQDRPQIIPEPVHIDVREGKFLLNAATLISFSDTTVEKSVDLFNDFLTDHHGFSLRKAKGSSGIHIAVDQQMAAEKYLLEVKPDRIDITGNKAGVFYALQTLQQLIRQQGNQLLISALQIEDEPRFSYRGLMLDVARNFYSVDYIKKYIDVMAHYKLNVFHWHLTDNNGWRLEIKKYPELTHKGAWRNSTRTGKDRSMHDRIPHGGYYSQQDVKDLVRYAAERRVTIIPEIEMPGHSLAALACYPELSCTGGPFAVALHFPIQEDIFCAGNEETFRFLENVLDEVVALFPGEYIHIGGDEAPKDRWEHCPKCQRRMHAEGLQNEDELQSYFIQRIGKYLAGKGKKIIGWDEILDGGITQGATVMSWRGEKGGITAANQQHEVIMTPNTSLYLDSYQTDDHEIEPVNIGRFVPLSKVYAYEPISDEIHPDNHQYIKGVQGSIWTEYIYKEEFVDYMTYPRALALAEISWSPRGKRDYANFLEKLPYALKKLDERGVLFRIPEPEGWDSYIVQDGYAHIDLQSLIEDSEIYYTTNGRDPGEIGMLYSGPLKLPVTAEGINVKCIVRIPSGRSSAIYTLREKNNQVTE